MINWRQSLRLSQGIKFIQKDRFNRDIGPYKDGIYDTLPKAGRDITITIDAVLQEYGELLKIEHDLEMELLSIPKSMEESVSPADLDIMEKFFDLSSLN